MQTFIRDGGNDPNKGTWSTVAANGVTVGTPDPPGATGKNGRNLKYDAPGDVHAGILKRNDNVENLGHDRRHVRPSITSAPILSHGSWKTPGNERPCMHDDPWNKFW